MLTAGDMSDHNPSSLFYSQAFFDSTRAEVMSEAERAGFHGDRRSHPHWRYIRATLFRDDHETLTNTEVNSRRLSSELDGSNGSPRASHVQAPHGCHDGAFHPRARHSRKGSRVHFASEAHTMAH